MTEELDKLEAEIKATQAAYESGDIIFKETHKAARAHLAAQRQGGIGKPVQYTDGSDSRDLS